jgi:hypothetical protein
MCKYKHYTKASRAKSIQCFWCCKVFVTAVLHCFSSSSLHVVFNLFIIFSSFTLCYRVKMLNRTSTLLCCFRSKILMTSNKTLFLVLGEAYNCCQGLLNSLSFVPFFSSGSLYVFYSDPCLPPGYHR